MKGLTRRDLNEVVGKVELAKEAVQELQTAAEKYKENKSEKWCESDAGEEYENHIEQLETIVDELDSIANQISDLGDE